jgi:hypothetical protein
VPRRRLISVAIVLLMGVALAPGASAQAAAPAFHPDQVEADRAIKAADEYWRDDPQNVCLGRNSAMVDPVFPERHSTAAGYTRNGECGTIHILRSRAEKYTRWQFCTLVVHEYGHTIDYFHVDDPTDIMYAKPVTAGIHPKVCDYTDPHLWPAVNEVVYRQANWR